MKKGVLLFVTFACILSMNMISFGATSEKNDSLEKNRVLISYDRVDNGDDTYTIERTYRHINSPEKKLTQSVESSLLARGNTYGSDRFTKEANTYSLRAGSGTLICSYQVSASFDWDVNSRKVTVYDEEGEITYYDTDDYYASYTNEKTVTSGNNTSKASAKFSFTRKPKGNTTKYNHYVTISCNYKGTDSGSSR
ncbi:MAG: hypothetical protein F8N38_05610 [Hungatella sp.]|nr:hypothetical protein [Hungatella sp.]